MTSLEAFVLRIKPAMDAFVKNSTKQTIADLKNELSQFNWLQMSIFNIHILVPLVVKLEELTNDNQELRCGCLECVTLVTSKVYIKEITALRTMLVVTLKQVRDGDKSSTRPQLSEELKLATVRCIAECFRRSTTDVLEQFYGKGSAILLGQILLTLVEFINKEKYKQLVLCSLECLMIVFYVHDDADRMDVVLRNQVADTIFMFLPKIITVLFQILTANDTVGETLKICAIKAMGRILCIIYEENSEKIKYNKYDVGAFNKLLSECLMNTGDSQNDSDILDIKKNREQLENKMNKLQAEGRTEEWIRATSKKLRMIFAEASKLRSHDSTKIRQKYAEMCCLLLENCSYNLKENFVFMLESLVSLIEDEDDHVRASCQNCISKFQNNTSNGIFNENFDLLLDDHLAKLPRIIARCDHKEQHAELTFLKGLFRILSPNKLKLLLSIPRNLEMLCMCLLNAMDLQISSDLLKEEYSLREMDVEYDYVESCKLPWRKFKNVHNEQNVRCLQQICSILGNTPVLNSIIVDYLLELLQRENAALNEILLMLLWVVTSKNLNCKFQCQDLKLVKQLLDEILDEKHWHLSLEPDGATQLKINKHSDWFVDRTPGLYESAVEIRKTDCDSEDEKEDLLQKQQKITVSDASFNVLHTCIALDCLGHCALYLGANFDSYIFQTLHKVLLKLAHSNAIVYKAANFALVSIQKSLRFNKAIQLIEGHIDYITYHLNRLLKRTPESQSAVDILTVVLQFSSRNNLPHLEATFETIYDECSKQCATFNTYSYLKVFNAFLRHITSWLMSCNIDIKDEQKMYIDDVGKTQIMQGDSDLLSSWLNILSTVKTINELEEDISIDSCTNLNAQNGHETHVGEEDELKSDPKTLPRHIILIKSILQQVIKFLNSSELKLQILSLECLTCGIPLLHDYDNELLPLIHSTWPALVERFRQKNALVLNRCFSLLEVLAINAKDFITKRCLDDVIPFLKNFLEAAAVHSVTENISVPTQEYKLQLKLLQEFPTIIECLDLDGKHLNDISEIIVQYLSADQPTNLQNKALDYFRKLRHYNGPLIYLVMIKKTHLKKYEDNVRTILKSFDIM